MMKKKQIRTAVIAALVLLFAVTAILRIEIEPADPISAASPIPVPTISTQGTDVEREPDDTVLPSASGEKVEHADAEPTQQPEPTIPEPTPETEPEPDVTVSPEVSTVPEATPTPTATPVPEVTPAPEEPSGPICTLEIRCDTVVDTSKLENPAVAPYVPEDGVILSATQFEFTPGESVFDVLLRATRGNGIHMEFREDSMYSGKYIEGINYLYEFDGGPLSGWMYRVNGQFPNYGCAAYTVEEGDAIVWMYTCDLGMDVGDNSTW